MGYTMPTASDEAKLYGHVARMRCQNPRCSGTSDWIQVAHSNQLRDGKGRGIKAYPWRIAALCHPCHLEIDSGHKLSKAERVDLWEAAHRATIGALFSQGLIRPI